MNKKTNKPVETQEQEVQVNEQPSEPTTEPTTPPTETQKEEKENNDAPQNEEMEKVLAEVERLKAELEKASNLTAQVEALTTESVKSAETIKKYEQVLTDMVEKKVENVPEQYRELIPSNLDLQGKLDWLNKAEEKGLFVKEQVQKPNVEIGKPMNVEVPQVDTGKLSGSQLLRYAYDVIKK